MTRISTLNTYESALSDLQRAQSRQLKAQTQLTSEKKATDLAGFGRESETLAAFRSMSVRLQGFRDTGEALQARLTSQDLALGRAAESVQGARQSIANAIAAGRSDTVLIEVQGRFADLIESLNSRHQGRYLFAGARVDVPPTAVGRLADLTDPAITTIFQNDSLKAASRLDEATTVQTGVLASEVGAAAMAAFRALQQIHESLDPGGNSNALDGGPLTPDQEDRLRAVLDEFDTAYRAITEENARTGALQNRVDATLESHVAQANALKSLVEDKSGIDPAEAITRLQQAQLAVQASAQVLAQLRNISLLNYLT